MQVQDLVADGFVFFEVIGAEYKFLTILQSGGSAFCMCNKRKNQENQSTFVQVGSP